MEEHNKEKEWFQALDKLLGQMGERLTLICVGGFVLEHFGIRATHDVDAFFQESAKVKEAIRAVGEQFGINTEDELWLNNSVQNVNVVPDEQICEVAYDYPNLRVLIAPLEYVAGMKLQSMRREDIKDVASIVKMKEIHSPEDLMMTLRELGFQGIDESLVLEAFGTAYGMDWLEQYYTEHEDGLCLS